MVQMPHEQQGTLQQPVRPMQELAACVVDGSTIDQRRYASLNAPPPV